MMKKLLLSTLASTFVLATAGASAQTTPAQTAASKAKAAVAVALCSTCGTVTAVTQVKRKGQGGAAGVVGGAVVGGVLGNQIGGGTGNTIATVGGAVAGGFLGNEVQKKLTSKKVWVTTVKMQDGTTKTFEQEPAPPWAVGNVVKVSGATLTKQ
jgi:outer membrane lipoprotein SlyB